MIIFVTTFSFKCLPRVAGDVVENILKYNEWQESSVSYISETGLPLDEYEGKLAVLACGMTWRSSVLANGSARSRWST